MNVIVKYVGIMHTANWSRAAHIAASIYILLSQGQLKSDIDNLLATQLKNKHKE